jgi:hypothetical protein
VCYRCKNETLRPAGLHQPLPIPQRLWTKISIDFVEGLPMSQSHDVIMVVVNHLSKHAHFIPFGCVCLPLTFAFAVQKTQ